MPRPLSTTLLPALLLATLLATPTLAQDTDDADTPEWDVTLARGETREIDFETDEGTWMSVDMSPDGQWIAFDLLAHVYRVPAAGGQARVPHPGERRRGQLPPQVLARRPPHRLRLGSQGPEQPLGDGRGRVEPAPGPVQPGHAGHHARVDGGRPVHPGCAGRRHLDVPHGRGHRDRGRVL